MAGIKQHYLPRLLLKGFASRIAGKEIFTWAYRKGQPVFEPNISDFCAERYFYSKPGTSSVDDQITTLEATYAELIAELRTRKDRSSITDDRVVQFVSHISVRTKHLRDSFGDSADLVMDKIAERLSDPEMLKRLLVENSEVMGPAIDDVIQNVPMLTDNRELLLGLAALAPAALEEHDIQLEAMVDSLVDPLRSLMPQAIKNGHISALNTSLVPEARVETYRKLNWFVHVPSEPVILGDIGVLVDTGDSKRFKSLSDEGDEITNVVLPISASKVLIGTPLKSPQLDFDLNQAIATCSRQFFISSCQSPETDALHLRIGEQSGIISEAELEKVVDEAFRAGSN